MANFDDTLEILLIMTSWHLDRAVKRGFNPFMSFRNHKRLMLCCGKETWSGYRAGNFHQSKLAYLFIHAGPVNKYFRNTEPVYAYRPRPLETLVETCDSTMGIWFAAKKAPVILEAPQSRAANEILVLFRGGFAITEHC